MRMLLRACAFCCCFLLLLQRRGIGCGHGVRRASWRRLQGASAHTQHSQRGGSKGRRSAACVPTISNDVSGKRGDRGVDGKRRWASAGGVEGCTPLGFPVLSKKRFGTTGIQMNSIEEKLGGVTFLLNTNMTTNRY
jgi:hypothetical protein